jgi:pSer/pThr/pTyr-binding forkhead associated (FHA) protein
MPSHNLHHPERPSKLFDFDPIYRILPTEYETLRIGRYSASDVKPYDPRRIPSAAPISFKIKSVSRQHCEVWSSNGQWWIRDVGSSGGTFLNGQHLYADAEGSGSSPPYRLHDNDLLELGSGSSRSEHVMIQVSFKGWSKNRSSTEERGRVPQQDRKIPAAVERESETELGNKTGMLQPPTLSVSQL